MIHEKPFTLAVDIGGTGLKMMVVDKAAQPVTKRTRVRTPQPATPRAMMAALKGMLGEHGDFDRVSIGFPGVVVHGVTVTAPNLHPTWEGYPLAAKFKNMCQKPVRVANDADVQGYADISGKGVEMVITLGTGMGSALYLEGQLVPNLELGHHPFKKGKTYEDFLGKHGLKKQGKKRWNHLLLEAIQLFQQTYNFDRLYLGGGNTERISVKLPPNVIICENIAGLLGGVKLWEDKREDAYS